MNLILKNSKGEKVAVFGGNFMYAYDYRDNTLSVQGTMWKCVSEPVGDECVIEREIEQSPLKPQPQPQPQPLGLDMLFGGGLKR